MLGSTALPAGSDPEGAVATLFAYQPREGVGPEEFSGSPITAAVAFADPARPATRITKEAWTLQDFVTAFPADLDGFVQAAARPRHSRRRHPRRPLRHRRHRGRRRLVGVWSAAGTPPARMPALP
ncbi:hypothetical protein G5V59_06160 [Nocardioides sp. W3-2-3]|uniref:hypothetical protein n=1 Tax=Nocardioides convexus TaxID=2712224 RepID=UPI0024181488|nr:hypothetical protein [Nocardioides convexus]NGZ99961.1 hypothetical protein [Nocardioides convexus]